MPGTAVSVLVAAIGGLVLGWWAGARRRRRRVAAELGETRAELDRRLRELYSLQELSYLLSEARGVAGIADQVLRYVSRFVGCDGALLALGDGTHDPTVAAAIGTLAPLVHRPVSSAATGLVRRALTQQRLLTDEDGPAELLDGVIAARAVALPLRTPAMTLGALAVVRTADVPFTEQDLRLLSTVATHGALVLAGARFLELIRVGKEQWETTFDALSDGIAVVDADGRIRRGNRALARLLDREPPDMIGLDLADALLPGSAQLAERLDAARAGRQATPLTVRSQRLDRILRVGTAPMRDTTTDGWVVVLVEDVTEQKALEAQVLQHEKLAAVGQLVAGVAHELNNPLTSIVGLAEFLLQQPTTAARDREHLKVVREQAERAGRIVRNLLTFARQGSADRGDVDLTDVAQRAASLITYDVRLRKADLVTELDPALPPVHGDRYQLQQVVLNLLTNAVQAVGDNPPDRPRAVRVRTEAAANQVILSVRDSGPGIPDEARSKLFDTFYTTKEPGAGTGLGLSIAYGIVQGHGGRIDVRHSAEGGAAFVVTLPAAAPAGGEDAEAAPADALPPPPPPQLRVLLVDDDPAVRHMITLVLGQDGHTVDAARDASHAAQLLGRTAYDVVVADLGTCAGPEQTVDDLLCRQRGTRRSRTLLLTADVTPEADERLRRLGCPFLRKPFDAARLRRTIAHIVNGSWSGT